MWLLLFDGAIPTRHGKPAIEKGSRHALFHVLDHFFPIRLVQILHGHGHDLCNGRGGALSHDLSHEVMNLLLG